MFAIPCSVPFLADVITSGLESGLRTGMPEAVRRAVLNAALVDPRTLEIPEGDIRRCTCDVECNFFAPEGLAYGFEGGRRPRCHFEGEPAVGEGECWIQLEIDRINLRPDNMEVVLMEDATDRQFAIIPPIVRGFICEPGRTRTEIGVNRTPNPREFTLSTPFIVPAP